VKVKRWERGSLQVGKGKKALLLKRGGLSMPFALGPVSLGQEEGRSVEGLRRIMVPSYLEFLGQERREGELTKEKILHVWVIWLVGGVTKGEPERGGQKKVEDRTGMEEGGGGGYWGNLGNYGTGNNPAQTIMLISG